MSWHYLQPQYLALQTIEEGIIDAEQALRFQMKQKLWKKNQKPLKEQILAFIL